MLTYVWMGLTVMLIAILVAAVFHYAWPPEPKIKIPKNWSVDELFAEPSKSSSCQHLFEKS